MRLDLVRRALTTAGLALLGLATALVPATAQTSAHWNSDILLRVQTHGGGGVDPSLSLRVLTGDLPVTGWIETPVPGTVDPAYDGQASLAVQPDRDPADQRLAVVWVREDPESGSRDLAMAWMNLPSWEGGIQWITRDTDTPQEPRLLLQAGGIYHILYRRAEDGHLLYLLRTRDGRSRFTVDVSAQLFGGRSVAVGAYELALVFNPATQKNEIILAAAFDDGSGDIAVAANGSVPGGGDWLPVPLLRNNEVLSSSGGIYQFQESHGVPRPKIHDVEDVALITWTVHDPQLDRDTLLYRFRDRKGVWSDWARVALDAGFDQAEALGGLRSLLLRDPDDGGGIDPTAGFPGADTHLEEGDDLRSAPRRTR